MIIHSEKVGNCDHADASITIKPHIVAGCVVTSCPRCLDIGALDAKQLDDLLCEVLEVVGAIRREHKRKVGLERLRDERLEQARCEQDSVLPPNPEAAA